MRGKALGGGEDSDMSADTSHKRICVVGSANVDLTFRTPRMPAPGETIAGRSLHQCMGGKGANQAVVAARLGAEVTFIASVGGDGFGSEAIAAYEAEGIDTAFFRQQADKPTGTAAIVVDDDAENCIIVIAGANAELTAADVRAASEPLAQAKVVLSQLETPVETAIEAFRIARDANVITVLTPAPAANVTDELLSLCDVCVPNRTEIASMVGQPVESEQDAIQAGQLLRERGVKRVALTLGAEGVLLFDETGSTHVPSLSVDAIDTTGAGDAFTGAMAVGLAAGLPLNDAARRAATVAAISVGRIGTQTSFPRLAEVKKFEESRR